MNDDLHHLAESLHLDAADCEYLRLQFGHACAQRVRHFLEDSAVVQCLAGLDGFLQGTVGRDQLDSLAADAARLANHHQGSNSIDGCGHAAVSATYAVANALAGKAMRAAEYAAYAAVYGQGGYGAVADPASFLPEYAWQVGTLSALAHHGP
ncbi:MAG: hypothetical protein JSS31_07840 [Proteobacteria bacterium]|nr:hypothetical protein [Pseudomonadota bacterium]MBS0493861.1 hypothetical protein [Pseudomonadota bacterium]